jgi:hypothetical protein
MFNLQLAVYYFFIIFNLLFRKRNHLFVLIKYFSAALKTFYLDKNVFLKISSKHIHVWSYFEGVV